MTSLTARAPAKLIISGEHAVVHGCPALAIAVNRYSDTTVSSHSMPHVLFDLVNLPHKRQRTLKALRQLKSRLHNSYNAFLRGEKGIRDVLKKPFELLEYTTSNLIDKLDIDPKQGLNIHTHSTIPTGCGMGSSAAAIVSTNYALARFLNREISPQDLQSLNLAAENLQHGKSSGLDLYISSHGGCHYFQQGQAESRNLPNFSLKIINTGPPQSSTGECVNHTFGPLKSEILRQAFTEVTKRVDSAWQEQNLEQFMQGIKDNHRLLCQLGVVPPNIQSLIAELEGLGAAAKVCGAGAIYGESAGIVLVLGSPVVNAIAEKYGYTVESLEAEATGVRIV
ncbi:MAG: putative phopshomevalonate kinase [Gammaproteobacteria bacterium]|jgi:hydroxymethylglutaryl-CoA synthase|nr:putative phopshomevalonate kinase [Gammaproteobacteria bacterium]